MRFTILTATVLVASMAAGYAHGQGPAPAKAPPPKTAARLPAASAKRPAAPPSGYVAASKNWHSATPGKTCPVDAAGRPQLVLQSINTPDHVTLTATSDRGGFSAEDLDRAAHVLRDHSGNEHPVDPKVLDLVYRVSTHFAAQEIRIISGYRTPRAGSHSNHGKGRAIDLVVPGTPDEEVAKFAREQGYVGVGVYPTSGFVHLDVRDRSFFWVDYSGPGRRNRTRGILGDVALKSDQKAALRGEHAIAPFGVSADVDAALLASSKGNHGPASVFEDDEDDDGS